MSTALMQDCTVCVQTLKLLLLLSYESSPQMSHLADFGNSTNICRCKLTAIYTAAAAARVPWQTCDNLVVCKTVLSTRDFWLLLIIYIDNRLFNLHTHIFTIDSMHRTSSKKWSLRCLMVWTHLLKEAGKARRLRWQTRLHPCWINLHACHQIVMVSTKCEGSTPRSIYLSSSSSCVVSIAESPGISYK